MCPLNKETLAKEAKTRDIFEFREGVNVLRVLPPDKKYFTEDIGYFTYKYIAHWGVGPEGSPPVTCPRTFSETARCPICEKVRALRNNPAYKELVDSLYPRTRYLYNIIDTEHPEKGIQVMETGPTIYKAIRGVALDAEYGDVLDLDVGRNFKITLIPASKSKTGWNKYEVLASANPSNIKEMLPEGWQAKIDDLQTLIRDALPAEEIAALFEGVAQAAQTEATPPKTATVTPQEQSAPPQTATQTPPAAQVAPSQVTPQGAATPEKQTGNPECFGKEYSPSAERCKACAPRKECAQEYVRG